MSALIPFKALSLPAEHQKQELLTIMQALAPGEAPLNLKGISKGSAEDAYAFYYINNPDGTIRWIYPADAPKPQFLSLYNANTPKAKLFRTAAKLSFASGQPAALASGKLGLSASHDWALPRFLHEVAANDFAIFTGTAGKYRKTVAVCQPKGANKCFLKMAHTEAAAELLANERRQLQRMQARQWKKLVFPSLLPTAWGHANMLTDVKPRQAQYSTSLRPLHLAALKEMTVNPSQKDFSSLNWFQQIGKDLDMLEASLAFFQQADLPTLRRVLIQSRMWYKKLKQENDLYLAPAHGDFTPWNMYLTKEKLHVYDWEMASDELPQYYDLFHFIYQTEVLIHRKPGRLFSLLKSSCEALGLASWERYHKAYLLITLTRYLRGYMESKTLLPQAHWLLSAWDMGLLYQEKA